MSLDAFVPVAKATAVLPGHPCTVVVDEREIALFNVGGTIYAIENRCPHQGAPLADGWVQGTTVTCTWHAWCFKLTDGSMTPGAFARVAAYDVMVEDGMVLVSRTPRPVPPRS